VLGRKNDLFASSDTGGAHPAAMYTIVQTATLSGQSSKTHLTVTPARIADGHSIKRTGELMPLQTGWTMANETN